MKIKLPEHDHKLTNILKVILFSLLMLLPFLDIGTRCGYVLLNKNAYQSYSGNTTLTYYEKQETTLPSDISNGAQYGNYYYATGYTQFSDIPNIYIDLLCYGGGFEISGTYTPVANPNWNNIYTGNFSYGLTINTLYANKVEIFIQNMNYDQVKLGEYTNISYIEFYGLNVYVNTTDGNQTDLNGILIETTIKETTYIQQTLEQSSLDNVFNYSVNQMAESPLYNWTTNTGMYTGVNAMTTGLGITTPLFAILITYWMFLTIIYIILDIVLSLFTFMTHIFTKKE